MSARAFLGDSPAFPNTSAAPSNDGCLCTTGLTKRERFALAVMQGILSGPCSREGASCSEWLDAVPNAVGLADALLAELEKTP